MKNILVLGAGLVSKPLIDYLARFPEYRLTVASRTVSKAEKLVEGKVNAESRQLLVEDRESLLRLIKGADIVISLVPYVYHVDIAKICIAEKKPMVTTSYVSQAMKNLDAEAKASGIIILNEIGLDPGIDHMSAMKIIDYVYKNGGKVLGFRSYCGGLPAPEANTNPLGYKFSWSPKGVLMAGRNPGRYLEDGKVIEIPGDELFRHYRKIRIGKLGEFEIYPNRDSLPYIDKYGLKDIKTMFRGTIRNLGWCDTLYVLSKLGFLSEKKVDRSKVSTYSELIDYIIGPGSGSIKERISKFVGSNIKEATFEKLQWLGLLGNELLPKGKDTLIDIMVDTMLSKMEYKPGERDMIILFHEFFVELDGVKKKLTSLLVDYGIPGGDSSMSRTVSLPAAVATHLILDGKIKAKGVHLPVLREIYEPVMKELESLGISFQEE